MNIDNISLTFHTMGPQAAEYSVAIALKAKEVLGCQTETVNFKVTSLRNPTLDEIRKGVTKKLTILDRTTSLHTLSEQGAQWIVEDLEKVIGTLTSSNFSDLSSALLMVAHQRLKA